MPEGVEVRISVDYITFLENKKLLNAQILKNTKITKKCDINLLNNLTLLKIFTKGKFIFFQFNNIYMEIHFGMSGSFSFEENKHSIISFNFNDKILYYNDIRRFGHVNTYNEKQFIEKYEKIGMDIMNSTNEKLKLAAEKIIKFKNKEIKPVLLNQQVIAGIGNIYAIEGLFLSKILPNKKIENLNQNEILNILINTRDFMLKSYKTKGMSVKTFKLPDGHSANSAQLLQIYGKKLCPCGNNLISEEIGGRSTVYCNKCQK